MKKRHIRSESYRTARPERKERVTVSLSRESAEYVRARSTKERSHVSSVVERMIESARRAEELRQLNASISAFYDALPESAVAEEEAWGEIGAAGLAALVESEDDRTPATPK